MSNRIKGIIVDIGGDTSGLEKALSNASKIANSFSKELTTVNKALKFDPSNAELLTQKEKALQSEIASLEKNLRYLTEEYEDINNFVKKGNILTEEQTKKYNALAREIVTVKGRVEQAKKEMENFGSVTAQQISITGKKVEEFGNKIGKIGDKLKGISVASSAITAGITKIAIDFESAWTGVTKTVDGTQEELSRVKQGILDLSKATASTAEDIAQVAENAGQLGVATENVIDFTETMVRLGDSTNVSADEASTAIAQLYNIMGTDINTVKNFGSTLVALGNNAATTEADILNMSTRIAASGKQIGLSNQEVLALATTLSSVGLEAEAGGSAISAIMTQIDKDVALNTKNLQNWASTANMSSKEFSNLWKTDTMSAIQSVIKGMGDASSSGENLNVILDELGVSSLRQTDTMKRLSSASEIMADMVNLSNMAWQENTALTDESNKRYETVESKISQLKSTFTELAVSLGETLLPKIQNTVDKLKGIVEWFTKLSNGSQNVILAFLGIASALAPVLKIFSSVTVSVGKIMENAPKILSGISKIKGVLSGLKTMITGLITVIGGISTPVLVVTGVIAGLVASFILLYNKCEWFRNGVNNIFSGIKDAILKAFEGIKVAVTETIPTAFQEFISKIQKLPNKIKNATKDIRAFFEGLGDAIWNAIKGTFDSIISFISINAKNIFNNLKNGWNNIVSFFTTAIQNIKNWFSRSIEQIGYDIGYALAFIPGLFFKLGVKIGNWAQTELPKIINIVIDWFKSLPEKIGNFVSAVVEKIGIFANDLSKKFIEIKDKIMSKVEEFGQAVFNWITINIPLMVENIITWISTLPNRIWEWLLNVIQKVVEWGTNTYNTANAWISKTIANITNWFAKLPSNIWNWLVETFNRIVEWLQNIWTLIQEKVPEICNSIVSFFEEIPGKMLEIGKNIVEGLWNGIANAKDWLFEKIGGFASGVLSGVKAAFGIHSPSTLFRDEVGKYIAEGIGVGFVKNIPNIMNDMKKVLLTQVDKIPTDINLSTNMNKVDGKLNGNTISPKTYHITMPIYSAQKITEAELNLIFDTMNDRFGMSL